MFEKVGFEEREKNLVKISSVHSFTIVTYLLKCIHWTSVSGSVICLPSLNDPKISKGLPPFTMNQKTVPILMTQCKLWTPPSLVSIFADCEWHLQLHCICRKLPVLAAPHRSSGYNCINLAPIVYRVLLKIFCRFFFILWNSESVWIISII